MSIIARSIFFALLNVAFMALNVNTDASAATTALVDDSATVVLDGTPAMAWRLVPPNSRDNTIVGRSRVNIRLATAPWIGKTGKIYMLLPAESASSIKIKWRSQGRLLEGQLSPGGRTLVYAGVIREPRLEDVFDINVEADGSKISNVQRLRFYFEIDVD
jgi:hypothetical protein